MATTVRPKRPGDRLRLPLVDDYLREQQELTAVERFARAAPADAPASSTDATDAPTSSTNRRYRARLPATPPASGQQYAFEVDLDACTGCKACVTACHNLNGLDEGETWRAAFVLFGGSAAAPVKQTVSTACHHCLDPACMTGCPVGAYEKEPITGIVKHLHDQCIGCQYCTFTCPYEVPQYNAKRGIVRKCDMCSDRLAASEAPACVQACPSHAIAITVIDQRQAREAAQDDAFPPGAPSPAITVPSTVYRSDRAPPRDLSPADASPIAPAQRHTPLVVMLVLTQLSAGTFLIDAIAGNALTAGIRDALQPAWSLAALSAVLVALGVSVFHLGRPRYAFRVVLGLPTSWLSREIVAFGLFTLLAAAYAWSLAVGPTWSAVHAALRWTVAGLGVAGIACSVLLYHVTRRAWWTATITGFKFFATAALLGLATTRVTAAMTGVALPHSTGITLAVLVIAVSAIKGAGELAVLVHLRDERSTELRRSAVLLIRDLRRWLAGRLVALVAGGAVLPLASLRGDHLGPTLASFVLLCAGELLERTLFFTAAGAARVPGAMR